jgi:hypothetical protein
MQAGFEQKNKGKSIGKEIAEKTEFNVIEALIGKVKGKKGKGKNKAEMPTITQTNPAYNLSLSGPRPPDWDKICTKKEPAMSDEEFENAIKELAIEYADRAVEIGNSGKSKSMINKELYDLSRAFEDKQYKLQTQYVSVVSPDRKAAYEQTDNKKNQGPLVYGNESTLYGPKENVLMGWGPSGWGIYMTQAEQERLGKFNNIYIDTLRAYEIEHRQIPYSTISKTVAPVRNYL